MAAYGEALSHSQKYFDYLIERSRALFPARTPEGKVKALNYLLPHIQRVPSRIVRDEWANEISHRLGIESAVLRQELIEPIAMSPEDVVTLMKSETERWAPIVAAAGLSK